MARRRICPQNQRRTKTAVAGTLRIIGGHMRGRPIAYLGDPRTRPMKQRVREAVFNLLGSRVVGAHVVDLFAGTGALTWEALSRGAISATLLERHFPTARVLHQNALSLQVAEQIQVVAGDTFFWARTLDPATVARAANQNWLVFCSPPYDFYVSQVAEMLSLISHLIEIAPPRSLMVVESDCRLDVTRLPRAVRWDRREYPPAAVALAEIDDLAMTEL